MSIRIKGATWRHEQATRLALFQAWHTAALTRVPPNKRLTALKSLLRDRRQVVEYRSPGEQRAFFYEFARRSGLRVERHPKPVIEYPVK